MAHDGLPVGLSVRHPAEEFQDTLGRSELASEFQNFKEEGSVLIGADPAGPRGRGLVERHPENELIRTLSRAGRRESAHQRAQEIDGGDPRLVVRRERDAGSLAGEEGRRPEAAGLHRPERESRGRTRGPEHVPLDRG